MFAASTGPLQVRPSDERLMPSAEKSLPRMSAPTSHWPCAPSYATAGSLPHSAPRAAGTTVVTARDDVDQIVRGRPPDAVAARRSHERGRERRRRGGQRKHREQEHRPDAHPGTLPATSAAGYDLATWLRGAA